VQVALAQLATVGFDVAHAFDANLAAREPGCGVLAGPQRLGILIGNTRALWPRFVEAMRDPGLARDPDPLERYSERAIDAAFAGARVYYAHRQYGGAYVPFQRVAVATGLGALAPSRLVIHPVHGPWFALRAIVVVDGEPPARVPIPQPCRCEAACATALTVALADPMDWRAWLAVRDACELRAARYSDDQVRYHYTKVWPPQPE